jgi:hypothetical protein
VGTADRKLPGETPSTVWESTPNVEMTSPFEVLGDIVTAVTFPALFWTPEAVIRPAMESNGDFAAPLTSNNTAVDPEMSLPVVDRFKPLTVVLVAAACA